MTKKITNIVPREGFYNIEGKIPAIITTAVGIFDVLGFDLNT